jgi:carbonic anhydrase
MKTNGGDLPGEYTLAQFHFHWGSSDHGGSEHTLEGMQFFSEVHLVHFKSEYETIGNSVDKSDGLAVLGFFIQEDPSVEVSSKPVLKTEKETRILLRQKLFDAKFRFAQPF